jgi:nucleotide-binding universal stress UspA family protein
MFETVVLALDGSAPSDRAYAYTAELARQLGSRVHVAHVKELMVGRAPGPVHPDEDLVVEKIRGQVAQLVERGIQAELELDPVIVGGPARVIVDVADRVGADLIVAGTSGQTALAGAILGSVAQRLLHLAHRPVLIVPHDAPPPA